MLLGGEARPAGAASGWRPSSPGPSGCRRRNLDRRPEGPWFDPGSRQLFVRARFARGFACAAES